MSLFDTRCYLLASPNNPLSAESFLTPPQLAGQTVCFESCDAVFVSIVRRCMEEVPMPTCLFTRRNDTRPEIHTLKTLAEHARAVEDGRL